MAVMTDSHDNVVDDQATRARAAIEAESAATTTADALQIAAAGQGRATESLDRSADPLRAGPMTLVDKGLQAAFVRVG